MNRNHAAAAATIAALALAALTGCAGSAGPSEGGTEAQSAFLNDVYAEAKDAGLVWTRELEDAALDLGEEACAEIAEGRPVDSVAAEAALSGDTLAASAILKATVYAADEHLCGEQ